MKLTELRRLIVEAIKAYEPAPAKPDRKPGIAEPPTKPNTPAPKRRTLTPPKEAPKTKPKAEGKVNENEKQILNKIVNRFKSSK